MDQKNFIFPYKIQGPHWQGSNGCNGNHPVRTCSLAPADSRIERFETYSFLILRLFFIYYIRSFVVSLVLIVALESSKVVSVEPEVKLVGALALTDSTKSGIS